MRRHRIRSLVLALTLAAAATFTSACAETGASSSGRPGVLTVAMTASEIPHLDSALSFNQGYEGLRFVGFQIYDGLTRYDLSRGDAAPSVVPGLAESWELEPSGTAWIFRLRHGVTFTDGTPFDADAVVFNFDRHINKESPHYYPQLAGQSTLSVSGIKAYTKIDSHTVRIETNGPWSHLPGDLTTVFMASPTAVREHGNPGFAAHPVGTGPFKFHSVKRGQELILDANPEYWRGAPKLSRLVLRPMPDELARVAALRAGEVNWIEAPSPDNVPPLRDLGYQTFANAYDHVWPWILDTTHGPLKDPRVRRAMNLAINRDQMTSALLRGTADAARQLAPRASTAHEPENDAFTYDPAQAKALLAEAGYPHGFSMSVSYPTGGSGNMYPGAMNEALRSDLAAVGIRVELKPIEWAALLAAFLSGRIPDDANALNMSLTFVQELMWGTVFNSNSPLNVGRYKNPEVDRLLGTASATFDPEERARVYASVARILDRDAAWLVVVNDRNPRALAANVHGFVEPQSWFVDLTTVTVN
ncbi:ABC transporter substrate-binding protein [Yinghuangia sp. YIM S09857]|uniref:ABC transporter substrate-binding protein n=1 Tax=Yinghuangia sp. YIM S09857 TaxID=3436929 RepID=UPI003F53BEB8